MYTKNFLGVKKRRPRLSLYLAAMATLAALLLTVIPANAETIINRSITTGAVPVAVAVNPVTNKIYVVGSNTTVIDGATNKTTTVAVAGNCLAVNPATNKIYVVSTNSNVMVVIDGATNSTTTVPVGTYPQAVAVNPVTNKIYVVGSNTTVIDGATNNTTTVAAGGNSLAVNPATNKIYVANSGGTVTVIDGATNSTTTLTVEVNPKAVAVNPVTNQIYVANYGSNTVTVIDGATNNTTTVPAGTGPKFIAVNPVTNKIYVFNQGGGNYNTTVTVIDGATNGTFTLGCTGVLAQAIVVNPTNNKIYVANYDTLMIIDGATNTTTTMTWDSYALAVNPVTNKLYDINYAFTGSTTGAVSVIDCATNSTTTVPVGVNPSAVAVNPATNKTYVANYTDGTVTVIDGLTGSTITVTVGTGPKDIAVNPATNQIYVANSNSNNMTVIDGATNSTTTVAAGTKPLAVVVNPSTNQIYVANSGSNNITVIDGATNSTTTVAVGTSPSAMAVNQATNKIYVANSGSNNVTVIDGAKNSTTTVAVGTSPSAVVVNPVTNKIYVANTGSNTVTVIDAVNNTTTVTVGTSPKAVAVNPATNKIYVANYDSGTVSVIDGITNKITAVAVNNYSWTVTVNPATNQIYTDSYSTVQVIDGPTNCTSYAEVAEVGNTKFEAIAVNPATNKIYVANFNGSNVTVIDVQPVPDINPLVNITPLTNNVTALNTANFTFSASSTDALPVQQIWYQVDSLTGIWQPASPAGSSANATLSSLSVGTHILYAMATDGQDATSINTGFDGSPVTGKISAYTFTVVSAAVTPKINSQPQNITTDYRQIVNVWVSATVNDGGTLSYQWQKSTDNGGTWNSISGEINANYNIGAVALSDSGTQYRCIVTNTKYDSVATVTSNVATLTVNTYTVTYNGNGNTGGSAPIDNNTYLRFAKVTVLGNPNSLVKPHNTFAGWNTQANGSGTTYTTGNTFSMGGSNVTLYTKWKIDSYTVTFDSNGGSVVSSQSVDYNTTTIAPTVPTRTGYTFDGWYSDSGLTTVFNFATTAITSDITLYAKWTINNYTVTFNSNGGSAVSSQSVIYNMNATAPTAPTRTGYTFDGWYSDSGLTAVFNFATTAITGDITLYAKWTINTYTVTFNSNGGSAVSSQIVNYNTVATKPADPTRAAYFFAGWYSDSGLMSAFNFSTAITADITLYAKWLAAVATPTFDPDSTTFTSPWNVKISCATPGATIHYTTNGKDPSVKDPVVGATGLVLVNKSITLKAAAWKNGLVNSYIKSASYTVTGTVATPTFSVKPGLYYTSQTVAINCATPGATIRYTTDGSEPTPANSTQYSVPMSLTNPTTLKAKAWLSGWDLSATATAVYNITGTVPTPSFSVEAGKYDRVQTVNITCKNSDSSNFDGTVIRYTTNGTAPLATSPVVPSGGITVTHDMTITAMAWKTNWKTSAAASAKYTFTKVATPVISLAAGTYKSAQSTTISCATTGAVIKYTTDGSDPGPTNGKTYVAGTKIPITNNAVTTSVITTIKAIAIKNTLTNSDPASAIYKITGTVATPVITPATGVIGAGLNQSVTMKCANTDATIYYTTDGTTPTTDSSQYTDPITVDSSITIKAKAFLNEWISSAMATTIYTGTVPTPSFDVAAGPYGQIQTVHITCNNFDGAVIRYTTNGTTPIATSPIVPNEGIKVERDQTITAMAWKTNWKTSASASAKYIINQVERPVISLAAGTYTSAKSTTISCATIGAVIKYTTDDTDPINGKTYVAGTKIPLTNNATTTSVITTIKAIAIKNAMTNSDPASATYTITGTVPTPVLSLSPGTYPDAQSVTISCTAPDAVIHYTVNGKEPTVNDPVINSGDFIAVLTTETLKAKAWQKDWITSATAGAAYIISQVAAPVISPDGGNYESAQSVTISCNTPGVVIHYTLNGNDPTLSDPVIATGAAITISSDVPVTLKARAWKNGLYTSNITTAVFQNTISLTVTNDGNGSTIPTGSQTKTYGSGTNISATPNAGYQFINWTQTGGTGMVIFGDANSAATTVAVTGGNAAIQANFIKIP